VCKDFLFSFALQVVDEVGINLGSWYAIVVSSFALLYESSNVTVCLVFEIDLADPGLDIT